MALCPAFDSKRERCRISVALLARRSAAACRARAVRRRRAGRSCVKANRTLLQSHWTSKSGAAVAVASVAWSEAFQAWRRSTFRRRHSDLPPAAPGSARSLGPSAFASIATSRAAHCQAREARLIARRHSRRTEPISLPRASCGCLSDSARS